jgi:putative DNA primase/helicase
LANNPDHKAQILERLSFEDFYTDELKELKPTSQGNAQALCPFHEDHNPSLSVNFITGLFKCWGCDAQGDVFAFYMRRHNCDFKEALEALGRRAGVEVKATPGSPPSGYFSLRIKEFALAKRLPEDFLAAQSVKESRFPDGTVATDFHYLDAAGKLKAIRHRFANRGEKKFRWRKGDRVSLYGLWKWEKIKAAGWCLLVEGETDALTCWLHGLPALGIPGKKTWNRAKASLGARGLKELKDLQVYLWEEPDAGVRDPKKPMEVLLRDQVAADLPEVLVIPAPKEFKDLSEAHCQKQDVKALVAALKKKARPPEPPPTVSGGFSLSDLGNARRLVSGYGGEMKYCYKNKKWYVWTGTHWEIDSSGKVERQAKAAVAGIYLEAADMKDFRAREQLGKFALASEDSKRIIAMMRLAQSEPGIPVDPAKFDAHPWLLNCLNGKVDLRTGELSPHDPADLLTCLVPVDYDPDASCNQWETFLYEIMDVYRRPEVADDMVGFLQRALGYTLTGSCREQCLFMLWGSGANGKSTMVNLATRLLGTYARNTPVETLLARNKGGEIPTDIARLDGPRFVTAKEIDRGRRLSESLVKELTGQDVVSARFLYGEYFDFLPQFKLWISTNNKPVIRGSDNAIWRRIMFVRFPLELSKEKRDEDLPEKLWAEAPGILAWLVRGCLSWQRKGLDPPQEVIEATEEYRAEMDVLQDFIADCCIVGPGLSATAGDLYTAYCEHASQQGVKEKDQMKQKTFGSCLRERGFQSGKSGSVRFWRGIGLREV